MADVGVTFDQPADRGQGEIGALELRVGVEHHRQIDRAIKELGGLGEMDLIDVARKIEAPVELVAEVAKLQRLPVVNFAAGGIASGAQIAAALALVIGISLLMTAVGLSPALGTFIAGVVLADSEYRHELESDIEPFKGLLLGIFFISIGASLNFSLIGNEIVLISGLVIGLVAQKILGDLIPHRRGPRNQGTHDSPEVGNRTRRIIPAPALSNPPPRSA